MTFKTIVTWFIGFSLVLSAAYGIYTGYQAWRSGRAQREAAVKIDAYLQQWADLNLFSGTVVVTHKEQVVFEKNYSMFEPRQCKMFGHSVIAHMDEFVPCFANRIQLVDEDIVILILKKTEEGAFVGDISSDIAAILLGKPYSLPQDLAKSVTLSDKELDEYTGLFKYQGSDGKQGIEKHDGKIWMMGSWVTDKIDRELVPAGNDRFFLKESPTTRFFFKRDASGKVVAFLQTFKNETDEMMEKRNWFVREESK